MTLSLRDFRDNHDYSIEEMAEILRISPAQYEEWETGQSFLYIITAFLSFPKEKQKELLRRMKEEIP